MKETTEAEILQEVQTQPADVPAASLSQASENPAAQEPSTETGFPGEDSGEGIKTERNAGFAAARRRAEEKAARTIEAVRGEAEQAAQETIATALETLPAYRAAQEEGYRARLTGELADVTALNPEIKTMADLVRLPDYDRFYAYVQKGNSLGDAYKLLHFDELRGSAAAAARQSAINSTRGKEHLQHTELRGAMATAVPPEQMRIYRDLVPDATDAEIRAHYKSYGN